MNEQRKGRFTLMMLVLVFALPVAGVALLHMLDWRPGGSSYGELLQPPRALAFPALTTAAGTPFAAPEWQRKWHMVYVSTGPCTSQCRSELHGMRQLHASLAKQIDRIERVWIVAGTPPAQDLNTIRHEYPDLVVLPGADALARQFGLGSPADNAGYVYLVDPLGNLMMRYPRGADPYGMRKDLMRVLTYSWTG